MANLILRQLNKKWGKTIGVKDYNLEVKNKEFIVILGPSGCGKTTTMRMVAGLEDPSSGDIIIDNKRVNDLEPKDRDIAMVFQNYGLYPHMSVYENIRFPLKIRNVDKNIQDKKVKEAATLVELENLLDRKPKELSGGQRQRVALARAIVREPKIFLMDEPLSNLDAKLRVSTRAQLKNLQHELKVTTLYVTHDQIEAMTLADRVVVMNNGEIQQVASPKEIYNNPANTFVASFIGSPPMNIIEGEIKDYIFNSENIKIENLKKLSNQKIFLGFRAEDCEIKKGKIKAQIYSKIYSIELLGDSTLINIKINNKVISIKASKDFDAQIGDEIKIKLPLESCHFFDYNSQQKIQDLTL